MVEPQPRCIQGIRIGQVQGIGLTSGMVTLIAAEVAIMSQLENGRLENWKVGIPHII